MNAKDGNQNDFHYPLALWSALAVNAKDQNQKDFHFPLAIWSALAVHERSETIDEGNILDMKFYILRNS